MHKLISAFTVSAVIGLVSGGTSMAQYNSMKMKQDAQATDNKKQSQTTAAVGKEAAHAKELVQEAANAVEQMKSSQQLSRLIEDARGIYIVPDFGSASLAVGGRGGSGVMLSRADGGWSAPAFYDYGGISLGAQAGATAGSVAFILMSEEAVDAFKDGTDFSLNADAGLSIINYSANTQASSQGDVVFWSDTQGAYAGAAISVTGVNWDEDENRAFHGSRVTPRNVIAGKVGAHKKGEALESALSS